MQCLTGPTMLTLKCSNLGLKRVNCHQSRISFNFFKHKMHSNLIYLKIPDAELSLYCHQLDLTN